jgi:acetyl-CoA decarbonylase/synthase complex subunit delta
VIPLTDEVDFQFPFSKDLLEKLAKLQEIELQDVDLEFEEIELSLEGNSGTGLSPAIYSRMAYEFALIRDSASRMSQMLGGTYVPLQIPSKQAQTTSITQPSTMSQPTQPLQKAIPRVKPTELLSAKTSIPNPKYLSEIIEVKLGATKSEGGTRSVSYTIGGEKSPAYYNFKTDTPNRPIIALDVFDWPKIKLSKAVKMHFREVLEDTGEWARICVEKFGADMVNLHLLTIDPLIEDAPAKEAVKKVEEVLEAVDVPISVGGCGDPQKDLEVFTAISEQIEGERILINSVTLDMDIEKSGKLIKDYDNTVIAFTSMDVNKARELNRKLYDYVDKTQIVMDTTTAALGYGLDYAFTVMERCRLAGLKGDPELNHPISSGSTNAWAAREAWMKMGPEFAPRELRGPIWETVTAQTLLLAGVDYFMMMHPAAVNALKTMIDVLMSAPKPTNPIDWSSSRIEG